MMKANAHKYSVSAMCRVLQVNRSTYYYEAKQRPDEIGLSTEITEIFKPSRNNYGTRKIKKELMKTGIQTPDWTDYIHRDFAAVRIAFGQLINKGH